MIAPEFSLTSYRVLNEKKFFDNVKPVNFTTFATPNVGLIKTDFMVSKIGFKLGPKMMSRTGPQFYGLDSWSPSGEPMIEVLADPSASCLSASGLPH